MKTYEIFYQASKHRYGLTTLQAENMEEALDKLPAHFARNVKFYLPGKVNIKELKK